METITRNDLNQLTAFRAAACVSFFVRTHPTGAEGQEGTIALKNLLVEAESELAARGWRRTDISELLAPVWRLHEDSLFWRSQSEGLAIFVAPGFFRSWKLPVAFKTHVCVGPRFYTKHLMPLVENDSPYYLLSVSQHHVKFYVGTAEKLAPLTVPDLPLNLDDVVNRDKSGRVVEVRTGQPAFHGQEGGVFHGQGDLSTVHKDDLRIFFRAIDRALHPILNEQTSPLVFAGVDYLFPLYQEVNRYPHLLDVAIHGNPDHYTLQELEQRAAAVLQGRWKEGGALDAKLLASLAEAGTATTDVEEALRAAHEGKIATVFVAADAEVWGRRVPATGEAVVLTGPEPGAYDLLDEIAASTWSHGGRVHVVPAAEMPKGCLVAAVFRYALSPPARATAGV